MPWAVAAGAGWCVASPCGEPRWDARAEAEAEAAPTRHTAMTDWRPHLHRAAAVSTRAPHTRERQGWIFPICVCLDVRDQSIRGLVCVMCVSFQLCVSALCGDVSSVCVGVAARCV